MAGGALHDWLHQSVGYIRLLTAAERVRRSTCVENVHERLDVRGAEGIKFPVSNQPLARVSPGTFDAMRSAGMKVEL